MQRLARELALSETVFVLPPRDGPADARMRIFTPTAELPFAGHPTLGAAVLVAIALERGTVSLQTGMGVVGAHVRAGRGRGAERNRQPADPVLERFRRRRNAAERPSAWRARSSPWSATRTAPVTCSWRSAAAEEVAALRPDLGALSAWASWASAASRLPGSVGRRVCSHPPWVSPRTPRPARRPARWRSISPAMAGSGSASGSRSSRARRSGDRRCCMPAREGVREGSQAVEVGGAVVAVARGEFALPHGACPAPVCDRLGRACARRSSANR